MMLFVVAKNIFPQKCPLLSNCHLVIITFFFFFFFFFFQVDLDAPESM
jgi:hypothetical protein